jgi:hypothetical protein
MDALISIVLGVVVLVVLAVLVLTWLGVGDQFLNPVIGVAGRPVIRLSRRINAVRRERAIRRLPPDVPPPPPSP